jgi:hypothetical protein
VVNSCMQRNEMFGFYSGADKSLALRASLSIVFSVHGTGGIPTGPDPENRVGDQDIGSPGGLISSELQVPVSHFLPGRSKVLSAPRYRKEITRLLRNVRFSWNALLRGVA